MDLKSVLGSGIGCWMWLFVFVRIWVHEYLLYNAICPCSNMVYPRLFQFFFSDVDDHCRELYSETLKQSNVEVDQLSNAETKNFDSIDCDGDELWHDDGSSWNGSNEELDKASELDREWQRRREQFHTIGYRDGLMAGKEASAQEGFNIGFGESVFVGYKWGLVRGVTSAPACLPDAVRKRLVEYEEKELNSLTSMNLSMLFQQLMH